MPTPAGIPATLYYPPNEQQHVFYRGIDNGIYQVFYDPSTNSVHGPEQWDTDVAGDFGLGSPATMYTSNQQHVFHINSFGSVMHICFDSIRGRFTEQWADGAATGGTPATLYSNNNGQQHIFYRGRGNQLYQVYWQYGPIGVGNPEEWADDIVGNPTTMYTPNQQHVFYRNSNNYIIHLYYDESTNKRSQPEQWVGPEFSTKQVLAAGDPVTMYDPNGQQHLFYHGTDGNIYHVFYDPSSKSLHGPETWVIGASEPASLYTPNGQQHIFFRGGGHSTNNIYHLFFNQASNKLQDDGEWASGAVSDPATMYSNNGQQHVFYRGADNGIYHVFYDPKKNAVVPSRTTAEKWA
jgi:hypothetical protein